MIRLDSITKSYLGGNGPVLDNFCLDIKEGEFIAILGPSGCGKTTLLNIILRIINDYSGKVDIDLEEVCAIFQDASLVPWLTLKDNLLLVNDDFDRVMGAISLMELAGNEDKYPYELSGGMCQRVNIARAIVSNKRILIMDEPFKSLDIDLKYRIMDKIREIAEIRGMTIVMITHVKEEAEIMATRIVSIEGTPIKIVSDIKKISE